MVDCTDGDGNSITTDQRGGARPQGSACDIGAYEVVDFNVSTPTATPVPSPTPTAIPAAVVSATPVPPATPEVGLAPPVAGFPIGMVIGIVMGVIAVIAASSTLYLWRSGRIFQG